MKVTYDSTVDILYIKFNDNQIAESSFIKPFVLIDLDEEKEIVGFEVLDASKHGYTPGSDVYRLLNALNHE